MGPKWFDSVGERKRVKIMLIAGSDLIKTMSEPGVWSPEDVGLRVSNV